MKIHKYYDVEKFYKVGDTVWACAFDYSDNKESKSLYQKPICGMFTAGNTESSNNYKIKRGFCVPSYFVPFKKDGKTLAFSKAVKISARKYASTEAECIELFNKTVLKYINWHQSEIKALTDLMV